MPGDGEPRLSIPLDYRVLLFARVYRYDRDDNDFCIEGAKAPLFFMLSSVVIKTLFFNA